MRSATTIEYGPVTSSVVVVVVVDVGNPLWEREIVDTVGKK